MKRVLKCRECGKQDETVHKRLCAYEQEINDKDVSEIICDDCEENHREEI